MLYFLKKIGHLCSILDSDDGALDWIYQDELNAYIKDGVAISGVDAKTGELTPQAVKLPGFKCNWADGENIFRNVRNFSVWPDSGKFDIMVTAKRHFKGRLIKESEYHGKMVFNSGVQVPISGKDYDLLVSRNLEIALVTLNEIGQELRPKVQS